MRSPFVTQRLIDERPSFDRMAATNGYSYPGEQKLYSQMSWHDLEAQAELDESMFGYEGFMARFEIYRRENDI